MENIMFVLGASGFVGQRVVKEALASGWKVKALARSADSAQQLAATGAEIVYGSADNSRDWVDQLRGARVVIDLLQPKIPSRLTQQRVKVVSEERQRLTRELLSALNELPKQQRPLLISVSGTDDFSPDEHSRVTSYTPIRSDLVGFAHIGVPVRRLVEKSGVDATFAYLASVYGPGKTFADIIIPRIVNGRWRVLGDGRNRMPLVHVEDAARALVHIASMQRTDVLKKNFIIADRDPVSAREFYDHTAQLIGAKRPGRAPRWLGSLIAGPIMVETMTRDLVADSTELRKSGFEFKYPSYRDGLPPTIEALGYKRQPPAATPGGKKGLAFALLTIATFGALAAENLLDFKLSVPSMLRYAGGLPLLDMRLGYTPDAAYHLLDVLGTSGREAYMQLLWSVDILIPCLAMLFLWSAISRGALKRLRFLALIGGVADYLENIAVTALLMLYPEHWNGFVSFASTFTLIKTVGYLSGFAVAIIGFAIKLFARKKLSKPGYL